MVTDYRNHLSFPRDDRNISISEIAVYQVDIWPQFYFVNLFYYHDLQLHQLGFSDPNSGEYSLSNSIESA